MLMQIIVAGYIFRLRRARNATPTGGFLQYTAPLKTGAGRWCPLLIKRKVFRVNIQALHRKVSQAMIKRAGALCRLRAPCSSVSQSSVRRLPGQRHDGSCEKLGIRPRTTSQRRDSSDPQRHRCQQALKSPAPALPNIFPNRFSLNRCTGAGLPIVWAAPTAARLSSTTPRPTSRKEMHVGHLRSRLSATRQYQRWSFPLGHHAIRA